MWSTRSDKAIVKRGTYRGRFKSISICNSLMELLVLEKYRDESCHIGDEMFNFGHDIILNLAKWLQLEPRIIST